MDEARADAGSFGFASDLSPTGTAGSTTKASFSGDLSDVAQVLDDPKLVEVRLDAESADDGDDLIPPERRWRIDFSPGLTEGQYARQLDALGIELGVLTDDGKITYVSGVGRADAKARTAARGEEKRIYWTWNRGDLVKADKSLLANTGVASGDQVVLHFCTPETSKKLEALESQFKNRKPNEIEHTLFSVKQTFRGYEVYVVEQTTR